MNKEMFDALEDLSIEKGINKDYFGLLDKNNKIKKIEKQDEMLDMRTNRNIFNTLIEPNIIGTQKAI